VSTASPRLERPKARRGRLARAWFRLCWIRSIRNQARERCGLSEAAAGQILSLPNPATAIFAANNRICVGLLRAIRESGKLIAVIGFDDFELADLLPIPVTVVAYDAGEIGRAAAEPLFSRLGGDSRPPQKIVIPTRLIARGSGELKP
jgi:LacI family transcriptional regulator